MYFTYIFVYNLCHFYCYLPPYTHPVTLHTPHLSDPPCPSAAPVQADNLYPYPCPCPCVSISLLVSGVSGVPGTQPLPVLLGRLLLRPLCHQLMAGDGEERSTRTPNRYRVQSLSPDQGGEGREMLYGAESGTRVWDRYRLLNQLCVA